MAEIEAFGIRDAALLAFLLASSLRMVVVGVISVAAWSLPGPALAALEAYSADTFLMCCALRASACTMALWSRVLLHLASSLDTFARKSLTSCALLFASISRCGVDDFDDDEIHFQYIVDLPSLLWRSPLVLRSS